MSNKYFNVKSFRSHVHNLNNEIIEITPEALTTLQCTLGQKFKKCLPHIVVFTRGTFDIKNQEFL